MNEENLKWLLNNRSKARTEFKKCFEFYKEFKKNLDEFYKELDLEDLRIDSMLDNFIAAGETKLIDHYERKLAQEALKREAAEDEKNEIRENITVLATALQEEKERYSQLESKHTQLENEHRLLLRARGEEAND